MNIASRFVHITSDQKAPALDYKNSKNMDYLMNYWRGIVESKTKQQGPLYAEGGPLKPDEIQGT